MRADCIRPPVRSRRIGGGSVGPSIPSCVIWPISFRSEVVVGASFRPSGPQLHVDGRADRLDVFDFLL